MNKLSAFHVPRLLVFRRKHKRIKAIQYSLISIYFNIDVSTEVYEKRLQLLFGREESSNVF